MAIPVVIATNGYGLPVKAVSDRAPNMVVASNGYGLPIVLSDFGVPFVVSGLNPDNTAPVLSSATDATNGHDAYTGTVTTDEAGGILYHVVTTSSTAPTAAQVVAGNDHTGSPAVQTGANAVGATGVRNVSGSGLSPETAYYIHFAQRDGGANLSNVASGNGFTTEAAPDVTGPTLSSASSAKDGHDAYTGSISTNETGTLWHTKTATATPASIAAIKAGSSQAMGSTGVQNVSGSADPETTYFLQFYAEDASDNGSNIVVSSAFTTDSSPDVTSPTLSSATDDKNGDTASTGSVSTNEGNGTLYWVITTSSTSPSAAQVKAGNDHTGSTATDSDSQAVSGTGVQNMAGSGLTPETGYYTHFMHEDAASNQSTVATASGFTTDATPDTTDPVIDSVSFDEANDEIDLTFTESSLPVTVYWQVRAVATGAPNQAAMIANTGGLDGDNYTVSSSPDSESIDLSALSDGDYTLYVMLKDPSDNYSTISDDDFTLTTPDVTAPTLSSATDAADGSTASTGSVSTNEDNGTLYWVVTTSGTAPSAAQVKAGQDNSGATAADSGSATVSATGVQSMSASGLTASTGYTTHFMHEDTATNQSSVASASGFTTGAASSGISVITSDTVTVAAGTAEGGVSLPTSLENDLVVLFLGCNNGISDDSTTAAGFNAYLKEGTGWTVLDNASANASPGRMVAYKVMGSTPDTTVTVRPPEGSGKDLIIHPVVVRGADTSTPIDNSFSAANDTTGLPNAPSHTTVTNDAERFIFGVLDDDEETLTAPSGWTSLETGSIRCSTIVCHKSAPTAGADDPAAFGGVGTDAWGAYHIAVRPA